MAWGDYDNDGDLDILLAGDTGSGLTARVYRNDGGQAANGLPSAPQGPTATVDGASVTLSWDASSDAETPTAGLTYNLRVGTSPGASDVVSPMASGGGQRLLPAFGSAQHGTSAWLGALLPGTYYWSVQAIDTAFAGSLPSDEATFTVACGTSFDPAGASVPAGGTTGSFALTSDGPCTWTATPSDDWITLTGSTGGTGGGPIDYSVAANLGPPRSGSIRVGAATFTIEQAAGPCAYSISPLQASFTETGGSGTISVTAPSWCSWTAASGAAWLTITGGAAGTGSGTVEYAVAANPWTARAGALTVAGLAFQVSQARQPVGPQSVWHTWFAVDTLETPYVGDFDGDGLTDIITFTRQNPLAVGDVYVALSNGTRFQNRAGVPDMSDKWHDWFAISTDETVVIGDFDGDGKDDIATWLGKTTRQVYVALSLGSGMGKESVWLDAIGSGPTDVLLAGDVDADGDDDLVCFAREQGKVYVALSDGRASCRPWSGTASSPSRPTSGRRSPMSTGTAGRHRHFRDGQPDRSGRRVRGVVQRDFVRGRGRSPEHLDEVARLVRRAGERAGEGGRHGRGRARRLLHVPAVLRPVLHRALDRRGDGAQRAVARGGRSTATGRAVRRRRQRRRPGRRDRLRAERGQGVRLARAVGRAVRGP